MLMCFCENMHADELSAGAVLILSSLRRADIPAGTDSPVCVGMLSERGGGVRGAAPVVGTAD